MKAIGLDIGTTSICGVLLDVEKGQVTEKIEKNNNTWIESENTWEKIQNPSEILDAVYEILEALYNDDVVSIGIDGQMHGILYLNKEGDAVSPLYTWQDERGDLPYKDSTYAACLKSHSGYGYVTHFYNKTNSLVPKDAVVFCTIHDYAAMKISGKTSPLIHNSDAASFGQYDLKTNSFTIKDEYLPEVTDGYKELGRYKNASVAVAIGDNQASFMGSACGAGSVLVNAGTGSQVSVAVDEIFPCEETEIRPYIENRYLMVGCSLCGGKSFAVIESFLRKTVELFTDKPCDNLYAVMDKVLENKIDTTLIVDNRFMGTRAKPEIRGSISNITTENLTPEGLMLATVDGMTEELYELFREMETTCVSLIGSGNGIRKNKAFRRSLSEKFGKKLQIPCHKEEACFGAALFSLVTAGKFANMAEAQKIIKYEV